MVGMGSRIQQGKDEEHKLAGMTYRSRRIGFLHLAEGKCLSCTEYSQESKRLVRGARRPCLSVITY
ncbi:MAG: hypothetical protein FRX49_07703 [Trebouxia sp. A1-2]|nr:MAG: hypothetical protein FRX49_07703 [Trebouxia sp. A1-2]